MSSFNEPIAKRLRSSSVVDQNNDGDVLCVMLGMHPSDGKTVADFSKTLVPFFKKAGFTVRVVDVVETLPGDGGDGGRVDVLFYVCNNIMQFATHRLRLHWAGIQIKWWSDAIDNFGEIYPQTLKDKYK